MGTHTKKRIGPSSQRSTITQHAVAWLNDFGKAGTHHKRFWSIFFLPKWVVKTSELMTAINVIENLKDILTTSFLNLIRTIFASSWHWYIHICRHTSWWCHKSYVLTKQPCMEISRIYHSKLTKMKVQQTSSYIMQNSDEYKTWREGL